jgi:hypothetical protein
MASFLERVSKRLQSALGLDDPLESFVSKGRPYTTMTDEELAGQSFPALDELRARAYSSERFQLTPRQFLEPYYGKNLDTEIAAARGVQGAQDVGGAFYSVYRKAFEQDYSKIDEPVNFEIQQNPRRQYSPDYTYSKNLARLNDPSFQWGAKQDAENLASPDPEKQKRIEKFMRTNAYIPEDITFAAQNPMNKLVQDAEHEMGHSFTSSTMSSSHPRTKGRGHIAKPNEMANALGKIQRDTYSIFNQRFDKRSFSAFMEKEAAKKPEERFKDYSRESKRGLRTLMEFYEKKEEPFQWAADNIGKFVKTNQKAKPVA